jgi:D-alanyl-D-alanine carboxypeptidase
VAVISLKNDSLVFSYNAARPMIPASNLKLLVTAAAWDCWNDSLVSRLRHKLGRRAALHMAPSRPDRSTRAKERKKPIPAAADTANQYFPEYDSLTGLRGFDLLCRLHKLSDNYVANRLLDCLAQRLKLSPMDVIGRYLDRVGIWEGGLNVVDGSGRSPANRAAPLTLAQVLRDMHQAPKHDAFLRSLAVAGKDGTLRRHSFSLGERVRAKTGSIFGTYSLSGFLAVCVSDTLPGDTLAFSVILNQCYDKQRAFDFFSDLLSALEPEETNEVRIPVDETTD